MTKALETTKGSRHKQSTDAISARVRKIMHLGYYVPRERHPNEAALRDYNLWQRPVYDGAELRCVAAREGSMAAYSLPSIGI